MHEICYMDRCEDLRTLESVLRSGLQGHSDSRPHQRDSTLDQGPMFIDVDRLSGPESMSRGRHIPTWRLSIAAKLAHCAAGGDVPNAQ